jgi:DNA adenine methylase
VNDDRDRLVYLKYAGNKTKHTTRIRQLFGGPPDGGYIEPFLGSGAVFFARAKAGDLDGKGVVLADKNARLVELHRTVRDELDGFLLALSALPWGSNFRVHYDRIKTLFNREAAHGPAHAARYVWLNRACFNGLYRESKNGTFNVPVGSYKSISRPDDQLFTNASAWLQKATSLTCTDYQDTLKEAGEGDQVYADPPFLPESKTASFSSYTQGVFSTADHETLARNLIAARDRGAVVVVSGSGGSATRELYGDLGFKLEDFEVSRSISSKSSTRGKRMEVLMTLPSVAPGLAPA